MCRETVRAPSQYSSITHDNNACDALRKLQSALPMQLRYYIDNLWLLLHDAVGGKSEFDRRSRVFFTSHHVRI